MVLTSLVKLVPNLYDVDRLIHFLTRQLIGVSRNRCLFGERATFVDTRLGLLLQLLEHSLEIILGQRTIAVVVKSDETVPFWN